MSRNRAHVGSSYDAFLGIFWKCLRRLERRLYCLASGGEHEDVDDDASAGNVQRQEATSRRQLPRRRICAAAPWTWSDRNDNLGAESQGRWRGDLGAVAELDVTAEAVDGEGRSARQGKEGGDL